MSPLHLLSSRVSPPPFQPPCFAAGHQGAFPAQALGGFHPSGLSGWGRGRPSRKTREWPGLSNGVGRRDYFEVNFLRLGSNFSFLGGIPQGLNNPWISSLLASSLPLPTLSWARARRHPHPPDVWHPSPPILYALTEGNSPGRWHSGLLRATTHRACRPPGFELAPLRSSSTSWLELPAAVSPLRSG